MKYYSVFLSCIYRLDPWSTIEFDGAVTTEIGVDEDFKLQVEAILFVLLMPDGDKKYAVVCIC